MRSVETLIHLAGQRQLPSRTGRAAEWHYRQAVRCRYRRVGVPDRSAEARPSPKARCRLFLPNIQTGFSPDVYPQRPGRSRSAPTQRNGYAVGIGLRPPPRVLADAAAPILPSFGAAAAVSPGAHRSVARRCRWRRRCADAAPHASSCWRPPSGRSDTPHSASSRAPSRRRTGVPLMWRFPGSTCSMVITAGGVVLCGNVSAGNCSLTWTGLTSAAGGASRSSVVSPRTVAGVAAPNRSHHRTLR